MLNNVKAIKALHSTATITITGHSLGGALATHALVYLTKVITIVYYLFIVRI